MAQTAEKSDNTIFTVEHQVLRQTFSTPSEVPMLAFSYPTSERGYRVEIRFGAGVAGVLSAYLGMLTTGYDRATGGDITKLGVSDPAVLEDGDSITANKYYPGMTPKIYTLANIGTQSIEIWLVGRNPLSVGWILDITIYRRST